MKIKNQFVENAILDPMPKYADENLAWQGAPSIARTKGGRLFVSKFTGGIYEPDPRNADVLIYSDDDGKTWSDPILAIESKPDEYIRVYDLELWVDPDGVLHLFWNECPYPKGLEMPTYEQVVDMENDSEYHSLEAMTYLCEAICRDPDADELFFEDVRVIFKKVMRNHPFVTKSGRWLYPTAKTEPCEFYEFYYSDDKGKTLESVKVYGRAPGRAFDEPSFFYTYDSRLAVVVRTTPPTYKIMYSSDDGLSWTAPADFYGAASQRPCIGNLKNGDILFIPSIHPSKRNGFKMLLSQNGGEFVQKMIIDDRERVSYAEFAEDEEGNIYIAYDRERNNKIKKSYVTGMSEAAKEILFAKIPKNALENGEVTPDTVRARVISKAGINALSNKYTL